MADFNFIVSQSSLNRKDQKEISPELPSVKFFLKFFCKDFDLV